MTDMRAHVMAMTRQERTARGKTLLNARNSGTTPVTAAEAEELQEIIVQRAADNAKPM